MNKNEAMDINYAIQIIDLEAPATGNEEFEAYKTFFQEVCGVNIMNEDGSYKTLYDIFKEGNAALRKKVAK